MNIGGFKFLETSLVFLEEKIYQTLFEDVFEFFGNDLKIILFFKRCFYV